MLKIRILKRIKIFLIKYKFPCIFIFISIISIHFIISYLVYEICLGKSFTDGDECNFLEIANPFNYFRGQI